MPEWLSFAVESSTKLLGFCIGTSAGSKNWLGPLTKFKARISAIKNSQASLQLNCFTYNSRAVPVASYVVQLVPLPAEYMVLERVALHSTLRFPINALGHADFFQLSQLGCPKLRSLSAACASALFRTAHCTITSWPGWISLLEKTAEEYLPTSQR